MINNIKFQGLWDTWLPAAVVRRSWARCVDATWCRSYASSLRACAIIVIGSVVAIVVDVFYETTLVIIMLHF